MDFYEVVGQVRDLLQRQERVSYRALKLQFKLDDDYLEGLKDELIYAQQVARDEDNRVLVWIGKPEETASPPLQPPQQPAIQEKQPTHELPPSDPRPREAERRQLTVMFCDLVDSTKLSSQLDPEDYRDVVRAYQATCTEIIQRYDGHIAQYLGDGLLVYFGYPVAHEEDAQRAVHTGLGIVEAIGTLNTRLEQVKGIKLAVRLGIHTGLVVVGEMGGEGRQEQLALGEVPNVASRIQGMAEANALVISSSTYRLVQGYFECQELGEHVIRGVVQPITVYRVLGESEVQSRLDVASTRGLTPLVGRESEVTILLECWQQAKDGQGQVILLSGEAGIGKSRLVQVVRERVADEPHVRWECRSSPYYQNTALYPITDLLYRILQWQQDDTPEERLGKLEQALSQFRLPMDESVPLFATLLSVPIPDGCYQPLHFSPQRQRQKTLESTVAILLELAEREPVLFILEDLHWTDPTTLEFLGLLVKQVPTAAIYTLLTCRPHFQPSWHHRSYLTEITVNRLSRNQIEQIAKQVAGGKMLPTEIVQQLVDKTDGVPLYVEEMTKAVLESGALKEVNGQYEMVGSVTSLTIPATLQDSLMARLDRLVTAKGLAQQASVIGRQFSYALLQAVSQLDEMTLQRELGRLVEAELVYQRGLPPQAMYTFKHALIQDAAYQSLLRSTRQQYHQRIARVLEERFPETTETQPELLAHHFTEAGLHAQALDYWHKAAKRALQRSAHAEAVSHLTKGLDLLQTLPPTRERTKQELVLLTDLGPALTALKGYAAAEVEPVYTRARELCQQMDEASHLIPVLRGLIGFYRVRGQLHTAHEFAQQFLLLAQRSQDPTFLLTAHMNHGQNLCHLGEFISARTHLEQALAFDHLRHHHPRSLHALAQDPEMVCLFMMGRVLWLLGYPDQALQRSDEALTRAQHLSQLYNLATAYLAYAVMLHEFRREWQAVQERTAAGMSISTEHGFTQTLAIGAIRQGRVRTRQGRGEEGIGQIRRGLSAYRATGAEIRCPYYLSLLAEAYEMLDQPEEGLTVLKEALALADKNDERWCEAELHRLKGELLLQQSSDNQTEAESCFHQAISIAQNQSAKSWELRAATSLAKLWQRQGKRQEAYDLLAPVYGWFTEGFDTADLKDAKALLDELR